MRSDETKELLKEYYSQFNEHLSELYTYNMTDDEVNEVIEECIKENKTYYELLRDRHGYIIL
ncbi:hypothetical protein [Macrococcus armenti]|uniref:hypothetical protein n=1 Tax=Macrococcus armenti TaxID=2875764 RepID=UPI001CCF0291|nr:hypothetical protein [Macrococcus armenti]UBH16396.1 hypothetical protein LAU44_05420 [Macrococcus armenti]UBH18752.1 hypothetical protein LAU39_05430 [Macrococcus armenti]UBH21024.1 hypothetical protein LAU40_05425 [Macrococcus armenti]